MREYVTFAQLADALRRCGSGHTADDCKCCAFYDELGMMSLCIPKMTERAAQVIELFAAEKPKKEGDPSDL